jgi:hypothetical protein
MIHMTLRKTSKLKFFKDIEGERVAMNSKRLTEIESEINASVWYTTPEEIRHAAAVTRHDKDFVYYRHAIKIFNSKFAQLVGFGKNDCGDYSIGCHSFSKRTFRAILRYAGVKNV